MAHPFVWPTKTFFYPIGNTSPVCLTRCTPPDERVDILLLACGDPRSILYTIHTDLAADSGRQLDFTCCDWEPAVLARNIILLTMIADDISTINMWPIFYHFFLDEVSYTILLSHCRTLVQLGSDIKTWKSSKYGAYIRFCTEDSLAQIRHHWNLYVETDNLAEKEKKDLINSFRSGMKSVVETYSTHGHGAVRAAGPLAPVFLKKSYNVRGTHKYFWSTGVTPYKSALGASRPHLNPTFVHSLSGRNFNVHYGTDPALAFHVAPALALMKGDQSHPANDMEGLFQIARHQFASWCRSFKQKIHPVSTSKVIIRFFVGESLAFCRALHVCKEAQVTNTSSYASPLCGSQIEFDVEAYSLSSSSPAPLLFNVIDTSNLSDHSGLINVLVSTLPLLQCKASSVLFTDTLHPPTSKKLIEKALADIPTLSILLGIAPSPHLWHFTTHSNKHEPASQSISQFHETLSWRIPPSTFSDSIVTSQSLEHGKMILVCEPRKLATILFSVYMGMFDHEDHSKNFGDLSRFSQLNVVHYTRASFVAFLALVKERVDVNWSQTMNYLIDFIGMDRTFMMGLHGYQEIMCQMYMRNVHTLDILTSSYLETVRTPRDRFNGWRNVPPIVCIVLKIPRSCIQVLENGDVEKIGTPMLHCESSSLARDHSFHNIHSSIQFIFGDIEVSGTAEESEVTIKEDLLGRLGRSPIIATFYLPSWILTAAPTSTKIGLHVTTTPTTAVALTSQLGYNLTLYSTSLTDNTHVQVVRHRPRNVHEVQHLRTISAFPSSASKKYLDREKVSLNFDIGAKKATSMIIRHSLCSSPKAAESLAGGAIVVTNPVSDCTLFVTFDGHTEHFTFPFPTYSEKSKTRIARKSSYIEIESPIRNSFEDTLNLSLNPFAFALEGGSVSLLNLHYLKLDHLPILQLPKSTKQLEWLSIHLGHTVSRNERRIQDSEDRSKYGTLLNIKESLGHIFLKYSGFAGPDECSDVFALSNGSDPTGIYAFIFVNDMKLDLGSQTVVLDACVVMLSDVAAHKITDLLERVEQHKFIVILTDAEEMQGWRLLLPALAERCRTWKHSKKCEYITRGIPATTNDKEDSPLCSCGPGKNLGSFAAKWKLLCGEATRIAIGPLFAFSSSSRGRIEEDVDKKVETAAFSPSPAPPSATVDLRCANCGSTGKPILSSCATCKHTKYCSRDCQVKHWKTHKRHCVRPA